MKQKNDGKIVVLMIIALIAFGIGSGIGISMGLGVDSNHTNNTTHVKNVTVEMTSNLDQHNDSEQWVVDEDDITDYNSINNTTT